MNGYSNHIQKKCPSAECPHRLSDGELPASAGRQRQSLPQHECRVGEAGTLALLCQGTVILVQLTLVVQAIAHLERKQRLWSVGCYKE